MNRIPLLRNCAKDRVIPLSDFIRYMSRRKNMWKLINWKLSMMCICICIYIYICINIYTLYIYTLFKKKNYIYIYICIFNYNIYIYIYMYVCFTQYIIWTLQILVYFSALFLYYVWRWENIVYISIGYSQRIAQ